MSSIEDFINTDKYQVFLFACRAGIPLMFAYHPWFIVNKKGTVSRWEVVWRPEHYHKGTRWGHVGLNSMSPLQGLSVFYFGDRYRWKGKLLGTIEGNENSLAARMAAFIEQSAQNYPYRDEYAFRGHNSNTYIQWVPNHFPEAKMKLPWNAFGKGKA